MLPGRGTTGRLAWVDASAGVAGDMLLGAFVDAGADLGAVQAAVDAVIPAAVLLEAREVVRAGSRALKVDVRPIADDQPHRAWSEIRERLDAADLDDRVRERALGTFEALAAVEARIHAVPVDDVRLHEVGAWDSIADVVGTCAAVVHLGIGSVVASEVALGSGSVRGAHGMLSVPVPAVLGLSVGWDVLSGGDGELATPTGMALLTTLAVRQGALPAMRVAASGAGAGSREVAGRANVVRVVVGDQGEPPAAADELAPVGDLVTSGMVVLEANVDDLDPRVWPSVLAGLIDAGAADAWLVPIIMKKGRPAHLLSVLARSDDAARLVDLVLAATTTIGVRQTPVTRWALPRGWVDVAVEGLSVGVKVAHRAGRIVQATPEFGDVEAAAATLGRPVREVLGAAVGAAVAAGLVPGAAVPPSMRRKPSGTPRR